ncbi:hypothetical protein [Streptomyces sp. NPDC046712]|uniref:hypothetical protein n=1 Tax=Streptomyces sp. NPDC046712 TaxID=3154802 RepID=UPI0033F3FF56
MSGYTDAAQALHRSRAMEDAVRRRSGWYRRYLLVFGATQLALVPTVLLWRSPLVVAVSMTLYALVVAGLSAYAARQRAVRRGFGLRHGLVIGTWGALYAAALVLGLNVWSGSVPFAVVAAVGCALPPAVGAWLETRRPTA